MSFIFQPHNCFECPIERGYSLYLPVGIDRYRNGYPNQAKCPLVDRQQDTYYVRLLRGEWGSCIAQCKHSCFPPSSPRFESHLRQDFFSLLLISWTALRSNPSCAEQWISQIQLPVTSGAKDAKKSPVSD